VLSRALERVRDLRSAGIEVCQGDLRDRETLARACEGVRLVYNTASLSQGRGAGLAECRAVNAEGVGSLVEAAAAAGVRRVVQCSTTDVHGRPDRLPADEEAALRPLDPVGATKVDGERMARETAARTGVELVVARPAAVYGPGDCWHVALFRAIARQRFVLLGTGEVSVHLVYVDDLTEGLRLCGESSRAAGRTYILAGGEMMQLGDLARLIAREAGVRLWPVRLPVWPAAAVAAVCETVCGAAGIKPPLERRHLRLFTANRAFDISRARAELGYAPRVGVREGVRRCLEWYRGQEWL
jgi:nucleoside-diphosphate-sugar epimerase